MNLFGWDTLSLTSFDRLNAALAASANQLVTQFDVQTGGIGARGRFGAWRVGPGGGPAVLTLSLPLVQATASGVGQTGGAVDISGVTVRAEVGLALIPTPDGKRHTLRFDFSGAGQPGGKAATYIGIDDPAKRLDPIAAEAIGTAIIEGVSAHADSIAFVLATVGGLAPASAWLEPAETDWCSAQTGDGRSHLALLSVVAGGSATGLPRTIDPSALQPPLNALLAISAPTVLQGSFLPAARASWLAPMSPQFDGTRIVAQTSMTLPDVTYTLVTVTPHLDRVTFDLANNSLIVTSHGHCDLPLYMTLNFDVTMHMPMEFDPGTRTVRFGPDPNPQESHNVTGGIISESPMAAYLLPVVLNAVTSLLSGQISSALKTQATALASVATLPVAVTGWVGTPFKATAAQIAGALMFEDRQG